MFVVFRTKNLNSLCIFIGFLPSVFSEEVVVTFCRFRQEKKREKERKNERTK